MLCYRLNNDVCILWWSPGFSSSVCVNGGWVQLQWSQTVVADAHGFNSTPNSFMASMWHYTAIAIDMNSHVALQQSQKTTVLWVTIHAQCICILCNTLNPPFPTCLMWLLLSSTSWYASSQCCRHSCLILSSIHNMCSAGSHHRMWLKVMKDEAGRQRSRVKAEITLSPYLELIEAEIGLTTHRVVLLTTDRNNGNSNWEWI